MPIPDVKIKLPLKVTNALATAVMTQQHDGTDFRFDNNTGLTKFGNGSAYQFVFDHTNERFGIGTASPSYGVHRVAASGNAALCVERTGGSICYMNATTTFGNFGTVNNYSLRLIVNSGYKVVVDASGNVTIPAAVTTVITGATDLYIGSDGTLGPNPSSGRFKENVREPGVDDTSWILNLPVKKYDMKASHGGKKDVIGVIAEEAEPVKPGIVRYAVHEVTEAGPVLLNGSSYDLAEAFAGLKPGETRDDLPVYRKAMDKDGNDIKIKEWKQLTLLPISVNLSDLIVPLLHRVQQQERRIAVLEKK